MTQYYTIMYDSYDTETCGYYYSSHLRQNSTTSASSCCDTWNSFSEITGTTNSSSMYIQHFCPAYNIPYSQSREVPDKPSGQELLLRREERIKAEEITKRALEKAAKAEENARLLLLEYLDDENRKRLLDRKPLEVPSKLFGDIKYHIPVSNGRIKAWKENKVVTELCLTVRESECLPTDDIVLTKLLHILHDEENMLRTAGHFDIKENLLKRLT